MGWFISVAHAATVALGVLTVGTPGAPQNTLIVSGGAAASATNYPYQFGRPFLAGAIPHSPVVLANGVAIPSQADVKNRYPDGSVEFAVISTVIPQVSPTDCSISAASLAEAPAYTISTINAGKPVFQVPANPTQDPLQNVLYSSNCHHFDGGVSRTMISTENTTVASNVGGQAGFTEDPPYPAPTAKGVMFSAMVCNGESWCPQLSVGCDEESGCLWSPITPTANGDAVEVVTAVGPDGPVNIYFNGARASPSPALFPLPSTTPSEAFNTDGTLTWGADGDHVPAFETGVIISDQIFTQGAMDAPTVASISAAINNYYATPGAASPVECSLSNVSCDIALSVTHQMVAGATAAFDLFNVSAGTRQTIGFDSHGNTNTAQALAFCGTIANCRYAKVYDQMAEGRPGPTTLTFQDSTTTSTPLTLAQMEALLPVGAASMTLTPGGTADAGTMLRAGFCQPWTQGSVAQTMMCADDTTARTYDLGTGDGFHPFRPRFYVTFWPTTNQVFVRAVGEDGLTTEQEDLAYSLTISDGYTANLTGTQATHPKKHWGNSRWSHTFWLGGTPTIQVNIDQNLAYLDSTRFLPNLDTSIVEPVGSIAASYALFQSVPHDIYDGYWDGGTGLVSWNTAMGTAGDSFHIGPFPLSTSLALHTPDWRMRAIATNMTDLAAAWPINFRESATGRIFQRGDTAGSNTGLGRVMSAAGRPCLNCYTGDPDNLTYVGTVSQPNWTADDAHQPSIYFPAYLQTGDPWYLDMLNAWAGWTVFEDATSGYYDCQKQTNNCSIQRGPTGAYGGLYGSAAPRAVGWTLRGRAETAFANPDGTPEKNYFRYMTNDAIAKWEGGLGITGTAFDTATTKTWVKGTDYPYVWSFNTGYPSAGTIPPLFNMSSLCNALCGTTVAQQQNWGFVIGSNGVGVNGSFDTPWMNFYLDYAVSRAIELGFPMQAIKNHVAQYPIGVLASSNPTFINAYELATSDNTGVFYPDFPTLYSQAYTPAYLAGLQSGFASTFAGGYVDDAVPGVAMSVDEGVPGAAAAWAWLNANAYSQAAFQAFNQTDPRWAIVPRTDNNVLPAQSTVTPP